MTIHHGAKWGSHVTTNDSSSVMELGDIGARLDGCIGKWRGVVCRVPDPWCRGFVGEVFGPRNLRSAQLVLQVFTLSIAYDTAASQTLCGVRDGHEHASYKPMQFVYCELKDIRVPDRGPVGAHRASETRFPCDG